MPTAEDLWIGQRITEVRREANLSTRQLAERLGWSDHSRVANYESGRRSVSVSALMEIALALSLPVAALLVETREERAVIAHVAGQRERAQQLAYMIKMLDEPEPDSPELDDAATAGA
jgi:transcriptional regulator with XRE-family HTH domain